MGEKGRAHTTTTTIIAYCGTLECLCVWIGWAASILPSLAYDNHWSWWALSPLRLSLRWETCGLGVRDCFHKLITIELKELSLLFSSILTESHLSGASETPLPSCSSFWVHQFHLLLRPILRNDIISSDFLLLLLHPWLPPSKLIWWHTHKKKRETYSLTQIPRRKRGTDGRFSTWQNKMSFGSKSSHSLFPSL